MYIGIDPKEENNWVTPIEKAINDFSFKFFISLESSIQETSKAYIS